MRRIASDADVGRIYTREVQRVRRPGAISHLTWFLFEDDLLSRNPR